MNIEVKKCIDKRDIKGLRYIFVDCLDVDPTFKTYEEEYEYCRCIEGFIQKHVELMPLQENRKFWNEDYWIQLKVDLLKNFSEKRFTHMKSVVKFIKADKVKRLEQQRNEIEIKANGMKLKYQNEIILQGLSKKNINLNCLYNSYPLQMISKEKQMQQIDVEKEKLALDYQKHINEEQKEIEKRRNKQKNIEEIEYINKEKKDRKTLKRVGNFEQNNEFEMEFDTIFSYDNIDYQLSRNERFFKIKIYAEISMGVTLLKEYLYEITEEKKLKEFELLHWKEIKGMSREKNKYHIYQLKLVDGSMSMYYQLIIKDVFGMVKKRIYYKRICE